MQSAGCIEQFVEAFKNINYERTRRFGKLDYAPAHLKKALKELGSPQLSCKTIHIAGTVGKGSTAHYLSRMINASGQSCGLYTSPHLKNLTERILYNGAQISEKEFCSLWKKLAAVYQGSGGAFVGPKESRGQAPLAKGTISFFDALTGIAFLYFQERGADFAVIEAGLGGRLDSTNNLEPEFCVITPIDLDHCDILGDTIGKIAAQKAGIIKPGVPVYSFQQAPEAEEIIAVHAEELGSPCEFFNAPDGAANINLEVCRMLYERHFDHRAPEIDIKIPGRFEKISGDLEIYFDLAHNARAMRYLGERAARSEAFAGKALCLYFNCMKERDPVELLSAFFESYLGRAYRAQIRLCFLNHTEELHTFSLESIAALKSSPGAARLPELARALDAANIIEARDFTRLVQSAPEDRVHLVAGSSRLYAFFSVE